MDTLILGIIALVVSTAIGSYQIYQNSNSYKKNKDKLSLQDNNSVSLVHNIPHRNIFLGRELELKDLIDAINSRSYIISIQGIGGIGKTSLAIESAYLTLDSKQFKRIIWFSASESNKDIISFSNAVIEVFGKTHLLKLSPSEKIAEMKILLSSEKCLLIVDNFENIDELPFINFINQIPEPSKVIITTREKKIDEAKQIKLLGLNNEDAHSLLKSRAEEVSMSNFINVEKKSLDYLIKATGGSPLALKWCIGQLKNGLNIDQILEILFQAKGNIYDPLFSKSWDQLNNNSKEILLLISIFEFPLDRDIIIDSTNIRNFEFQLNAILFF